jgi:hypothetical protein
MLVSDLVAHPDQQRMPHTFRDRHLVGTPLGISDIAAWQKKWPMHPLPSDLVRLLTHANGIHLWARIDDNSGRAYEGILPLEEWQDVARTSWAEIAFRTPPEGHLAMSYHSDGNAYLVLDTRGPMYMYCDLYDLEPEAIGTSVGELLDWWWGHCANMDPRLAPRLTPYL